MVAQMTLVEDDLVEVSLVLASVFAVVDGAELQDPVAI